MAEHIYDKIKPDSKTTILAWKVFPVETGAQAVPPWPGNPDKKFLKKLLMKEIHCK